MTGRSSPSSLLLTEAFLCLMAMAYLTGRFMMLFSSDRTLTLCGLMIRFTTVLTILRVCSVCCRRKKGRGGGGGGGGRKVQKRGKGKGAPGVRAGVFVFHPPIS